MKNLIKTINYITNSSIELKNKFTCEFIASIEFAYIFCQNKKELDDFANSIEKLDKIVERTRVVLPIFSVNQLKQCLAL